MRPHFRVSGRNAAPVLQMRERVPYRVPGPLQGSPSQSRRSLRLFFRGNDRFHLFFSPGESLVRVAALVRQKSFRRKSVNRSDCPRAIRCRAPCDKSPDRHAMRIRGQMRFRVEPPLRESCPGCLLSRPPHEGEPRNRNFRRSFPHAIIVPTDEASAGVAPATKVGGRIPPRSARAHNPEDHIDKTPVVVSPAAPASFTTGQTGLGFFPN